MTFADFTAYFEANQNRYADLAWDDPHQLTAYELRAVRGPLQAFQRGESSEGHFLYARAKRLGDADYLAAMRLFIKEEQTHAAVLGRFLDQQGIPRLQGHWLDAIFRQARRVLSLEHTLRVLLAAEVVAAVYYRALYQATSSGLLQQISRRIVLDEEMHLVFQCATLRHLAAGRGRGVAWLYRQTYRALMAGAALAAYATARSMLRAGGYRLGSFVVAVAGEYTRVERMQQPGALLAVRGAQPLAPAAPAGAWQWPTSTLRVAP
ncbi:MAG: ferritin-like domain-containing protein [Hymenobacter sp.]|nr:MAG: ferritin-like domain-containing protein [Hymenobacter sp.]